MAVHKRAGTTEIALCFKIRRYESVAYLLLCLPTPVYLETLARRAHAHSFLFFELVPVVVETGLERVAGTGRTVVSGRMAETLSAPLDGRGRQEAVATRAAAGGLDCVLAAGLVAVNTCRVAAPWLRVRAVSEHACGCGGRMWIDAAQSGRAKIRKMGFAGSGSERAPSHVAVIMYKRCRCVSALGESAVELAMREIEVADSGKAVA